jgi:hypothetical protein
MKHLLRYYAHVKGPLDVQPMPEADELEIPDEENAEKIRSG